jgi:hypothetical protein
MSDKMVRTQIYLPQEIYEQLKQRAEAEGVTMADQIREALAHYMVKATEEPRHVLRPDDPIWQLIGMGESGISDGSVNHDKYIYTRDWDVAEEQ